MRLPNRKCQHESCQIGVSIRKSRSFPCQNSTAQADQAHIGLKADEIFVSCEELRAKFGKDVEKLPLGAVGVYTATQKIRTGLQQLMAGSRNFNLSTITRRDLMSLSEECEKVTGIPYVMRAYRKEAEKILAQ